MDAERLQDDAEYQAGLDAILAPLRARNAPPEELSAVEEQARAYYLAKKQPAQPVVNGDQPAYPASFAQVASLIANGEPIPGIKDIPDRLNEVPSSEPTLARKQKPWERATVLEALPAEVQTSVADNQPSIRYIFGYGSLIFKPPPHTIRQQPGYIKGFVRRFASSSPDHRGTPEAPGRVVTLIPSPVWKALAPDDVHIGHDDRVWGVCFEIDPAHAVSVRAYLDYREKAGYTAETADIWYDEKVVIPDSTVYVVQPDADTFTGPIPLDVLGKHIYQSHGPSGANKDYLYHLAAAIREVDRAAQDDYLDALEREVRKHEQREITV